MAIYVVDEKSSDSFVTVFEPGGLFYTDVTLHRWECYVSSFKESTFASHKIVGLLSGPFFFILVEAPRNEFVRVLTPWGVCSLDYFDFRDHCDQILSNDVVDT